MPRCQARVRQLVLRGDADPAARAARGDVRDLFVLPAGRRHRRRSAPREERLAELAAWRADIKALYGGQAYGRTRDLAQPVATYRLDRADFLAVIDGMEMDVLADIRAPDWATLDLYCDRVASAVGRLSVRVFGMEAKPGSALAHHLGRALQLTNILRDLDEDAAVGRLYLPREALDRAGIETDEPATALASPALDRACAGSSERARATFRRGRAIMARCPRRAVRAPRIMGEVYRLILERNGGARLFRAAPADPDRRGCGWIWILRATPSSSDAPHGSHHRRRPCRTGRGRSPRRSGRRDGRPRGVRPGRRPLPLLLRRRGRHDHRQRQSSAAVGQPRGAGLPRQRSAPRPLVRAGEGRVSLSSIWRPASAGRCASATAACRGGFSMPSGACRARARSTICRCSPLLAGTGESRSAT